MGWFRFFTSKLHEDNSQLSQLLKQADLIDAETMGQVHPRQTSYINQNQFLAFALLSLDNKGKANLCCPSCMHVQVVHWLSSCNAALHCYPKP